jgi:hypothetical protein
VWVPKIRFRLQTVPLREDAHDFWHPIHLEHVLRVYRRHYNEHRPHRALRLVPPDGREPNPLNLHGPSEHLHRHDLLGGLIHEYRAAA